MNFTQIDLRNHVVYVEKDGKKQKFTVFQKSQKGNPLPGTGRLFLRVFDLLKHLESVDPNEKNLFKKEKELIDQVTRAREIRRVCGKPGLITSKLPRGAW